jgi:hypothetical protein
MPCMLVVIPRRLIPTGTMKVRVMAWTFGEPVKVEAERLQRLSAMQLQFITGVECPYLLVLSSGKAPSNNSVDTSL